MSDVEKADVSVDGASTKSYSEEGSTEKFVSTQIAQESDHEIKYRTCSWQKVRKYASCNPVGDLTRLARQTAALLFSEYICLAILSFPWQVACSNAAAVL